MNATSPSLPRRPLPAGLTVLISSFALISLIAFGPTLAFSRPVMQIWGIRPAAGQETSLARFIDDEAPALFREAEGLRTLELYSDPSTREQGWLITWRQRDDLDEFVRSSEFRRFLDRLDDRFAGETTSRVLDLLPAPEAWAERRRDDRGGRGGPGHAPPDDRCCPGAIPRSDRESLLDYQARLEVQKNARATVLPRGPHESLLEFQDRLKACATAGATIPPRAGSESLLDYQARLEAAAASDFFVPPRGKDESLIDFNERLRSCRRR